MAPDPIFDIPALERWGIATGIFGFMNSKWGWPTAESIHFIGLNFLIASVGMFDLRMLGVARGQRLPASYANFYICNAAVIVPTFNDPNDRVALGILGELFRDRPVVGIHSVDLVWGFGSLHCLTQQQPA